MGLSGEKTLVHGRLGQSKHGYLRPVREGLDSSIGCASNKAEEIGN